jgi:hypothetical protein
MVQALESKVRFADYTGAIRWLGTAYKDHINYVGISKPRASSTLHGAS